MNPIPLRNATAATSPQREVGAQLGPREPGGQPGPAEHPGELADDQRRHDGHRRPVTRCVAQGGRRDGDTGGHQREQGDGDPGRDRAHEVLQVFGGRGLSSASGRTRVARPRATPAIVACTPLSWTSPMSGVPAARAADPSGPAGAAGRPRRRWPATPPASARRFRSSVKPTAMTRMAPRSSTTASVSRNARSAGAETTRGPPAPRGRTRCRWRSAPPSRPARQRRRPRAPGRPGRHDHAGQCRDHRQDGLARVAQLADDELALELDAGDEEEDGQQPVGSPRLQVEVEVQGRGSHHEVPQVVVRSRPRRAGPDERDGGGDQQQHATDGLLAQGLRDEPLSVVGRALRTMRRARLMGATASRRRSSAGTGRARPARWSRS